MSALPTSDMLGHRQLHARVVGALDRCQESQAVDFKESAIWETLKWHIARTAMAMSNLRDGGIIIIGVSERGGEWSLTGIQKDDLSTYAGDDVIDFVNKYASPPVSLDLVRVNHRGQEFLAIQAREFEETPCVCKRNGNEQVESFRAGDVLVRPRGKAQTTRVSSSEEMHELLELAAEKRARRMIETGHRIGMVPAQPAAVRFDEELEGL